MKKTLFTRVTFMLSLLFVPLSALGYRHFYRGGPYHDEPRFDRDYLSTFDLSVAGGSSKKAYGRTSEKTGLLNLYGDHQLARIFNGVPLPQLTPAQLAIVNNLAGIGVLPSSTFGDLSYNGKFNLLEVDFCMVQNLRYGFFLETHMPIKSLEVTDVSTNELGTAADVANPSWAAFRANYATMLGVYGITAGNVKNTTVGDITSFVGWTYNNDSLKHLDFLDLTIKIGTSIPTADKADRRQAFSIAAGYDGHVGIPVAFDMAIGFYEWVTMGAHVGGQFFLKQHTDLRMKTHIDQNGFIKLALGTGMRTLGNLWDIGTFIKADHLAGGFSFGVAYSYTAQENTTIVPDDTVTFNSTIVNSDEQLKKWRQHVIQVDLEYDFAKEGRAINPRIGLFYNRPVAGKRIFATDTIGGTVGANITWEF